MDRVKDKVIVITGAASGLGLADATVLTREGAHVIMTDIDPEAGQTHADDLGATYIQQDVSEEASWGHLMSDHRNKDLPHPNVCPRRELERLPVDVKLRRAATQAVFVRPQAPHGGRGAADGGLGGPVRRVHSGRRRTDCVIGGATAGCGQRSPGTGLRFGRGCADEAEVLEGVHAEHGAATPHTRL